MSVKALCRECCISFDVDLRSNHEMPVDAVLADQMRLFTDIPPHCAIGKERSACEGGGSPAGCLDWSSICKGELETTNYRY